MCRQDNTEEDLYGSGDTEDAVRKILKGEQVGCNEDESPAKDR
jgi:hypothetical protein